MLDRLLVGDIFHATAEDGPSLICLVEAVTDRLITARTVTHQLRLDFDRASGTAHWGPSVVCTIDSVQPLPPTIFGIVLGMDRKYRLANCEGDARLEDDEKEALLFLDTFYRSHPLA
jgi:hypothetical protein